MKICPNCKQTYSNTSLNFCRIDGASLEEMKSAPTLLLDKQDKPEARPQLKSTGKLVPDTRYAKSGDVNIAYQVMGSGPVDLIYVPGWVSHLEYGWEEPSLARFYRKLASFSRLILFDKRGTGLSDQSSGLPTLEERMDDVRAVLQAVGSERAVVFGVSEGGNMAMLFAATYPEHTIGLITFGVFAKRIFHPNYPWAPTPAKRQEFYDVIEGHWGEPIFLDTLAPSKADDSQFQEWWATYQRRSATPRAALALARMNTAIDVRQVLPAISVPALVIHRTEDQDALIAEGRYIATQIPEAKLVELQGADHLPFLGDQDSVLRPVEEFVKTVATVSESDKILATVLCVTTDGNHQVKAHPLDAFAQREIDWFKGRVSEANAHSICATFDGPIRAIRCARAIRNTAEALGVTTKIGLHTGLCEMRADRASGSAVEVCKQVAELAPARVILLTNDVKDLISGSGFDFTHQGDCKVDDSNTECQLFILQDPVSPGV